MPSRCIPLGHGKREFWMDNHYLKQELYSLFRKDNSLFEFLQAGSLDGVWYWNLEKPAEEWMSPKFWEILGYDPAEKKHLSSEWQDLIFEEDLKVAIENFGKHCADASYPYDQVVRYRHKNGSTVWVRCRGFAIRDETGRPVRMLGVHSDLTQLKTAEAELREQQLGLAKEEIRIFMESVENSSDAVGMSTPQGKHYYQNKAFDELFGAVGENPPETLYVDPAVGHEVFRTIMAGGKWAGEVQMYARDRRILDILLRAYANKNPDGRITALVGIHTDITERKKLEGERRELDSRLHQTQRLESLGVLAGGIAHDFNNILMAVLGHADLALEEMSPLAPGRESLLQIKTAAMRAAELCTQMLAYSGKGRLEKRDFCLNSLVDEMLHMLKTCISKKCVLNLNLGKHELRMHGDVSQVRQVMMNLVMNASEAIGDRSGSISVSTGAMDCSKEYLDQNYIAQPHTPGLYVYVEVSDTGCGMCRETIQRMFEPFYTTKFTGRGLGLSAVMGIVQAHRGAVRVYSELGKGTTIKVLFPATDDSVAMETESAAESHWRGRGAVLIVDDEESVRAITGKMLERLGLGVLTALDGRECVALYRERKDKIDVVLLDLTMPHMNGEEAFRELRQINPDVRVILASGYSENDIAARFAGKGLSGCVQKPYTMDKLRSLLSVLLPAAGMTPADGPRPER